MRLLSTAFAGLKKRTGSNNTSLDILFEILILSSGCYFISDLDRLDVYFASEFEIKIQLRSWYKNMDRTSHLDRILS